MLFCKAFATNPHASIWVICWGDCIRWSISFSFPMVGIKPPVSVAMYAFVAAATASNGSSANISAQRLTFTFAASLDIPRKESG